MHISRVLLWNSSSLNTWVERGGWCTPSCLILSERNPGHVSLRGLYNMSQSTVRRDNHFGSLLSHTETLTWRHTLPGRLFLGGVISLKKALQGTFAWTSRDQARFSLFAVRYPNDKLECHWCMFLSLSLNKTHTNSFHNFNKKSRGSNCLQTFLSWQSDYPFHRWAK